MPTVKKARTISEIQISKDMAIDALNIKTRLDVHNWFKLTDEVEFNKSSKEIELSYEQTYHFHWAEVVGMMWKLYGCIFMQASSLSNEEIYNIYSDCFSRSKKEPVKRKIFQKLHENWEDTGQTEWVFNDSVYEVKGMYTDDEIRLLILDDFDKERKHFEKLRAKFDEPDLTEVGYKRLRIPEGVRIEVWRRDGGKCARCDSREKLEYDHIVPISKGGGNTARNIELLCERHNRSKSNNVV